MLTPEQQQLFRSALTELGPDFIQTLGGFLQPTSPETMQQRFQTGVVDPSLKMFEQQIIPAIQQRYADAGAGSSSALNQALSQGAQDLQTTLSAQYLPFMQGQQGQQLQALSQFLPLLNQRTFTPQFQQRQGILGPLLQGAGTIGSMFI